MGGRGLAVAAISCFVDPALATTLAGARRLVAHAGQLAHHHGEPTAAALALRWRELDDGSGCSVEALRQPLSGLE